MLILFCLHYHYFISHLVLDLKFLKAGIVLSTSVSWSTSGKEEKSAEENEAQTVICPRSQTNDWKSQIECQTPLTQSPCSSCHTIPCSYLTFFMIIFKKSAKLKKILFSKLLPLSRGLLGQELFWFFKFYFWNYISPRIESEPMRAEHGCSKLCVVRLLIFGQGGQDLNFHLSFEWVGWDGER